MDLYKKIYCSIRLSLLGIFFMAGWLHGCNFSFKKPATVISLSNKGRGWLEIVNLMRYPIVLKNAEKLDLVYLLPQFGSRSFNWHGNRKILCFAPKNKHITVFTNDRPEALLKDLEQVSCSDVCLIAKCEPESSVEKYQDLELMRDHSPKPAR